ncbi:MGMT family protein [Thiothrix lacustris]|uniref:MGMT family protein n=1 Tax=Thiothrix lacustris TaxID=525917 RepID=UPI00247FFCC4|nr:MGMT family protein [Thiothrix lacustris]
MYSIVKQIPTGYVATYGDIAILADLPGHARLVGYALHALPPLSDIPWQRVINAQGKISLGKTFPGGELQQRHLLEAEGIVFEANGKINLRHFRWQPKR